MDPEAARAAEQLAGDLRQIFGSGLIALVIFGDHAPDAHGHVTAADGEPVRTLALVERLEFAHLEACAARQRRWMRANLATPLFIAEDDFARSLDAFPLEFGAIINRHAVIVGRDPFAELLVRPEDVRRACEVQARSHVLHLREAYIEAAGDPAAIHRLVVDSAPALSALLMNLALLDGKTDVAPASLAQHAAEIAGRPATVFASVLTGSSAQVPTFDGARLFPEYLAAMEALTAAIDRRTHP
ncbi:MAG TPA: hypothetical protein VNK41_13035 [Vicinamibacterales bacterium]|nr:hypothetical protein [Vicinamibacterales bacterium]